MGPRKRPNYILFDLDNTLYPASAKVGDAFNTRIVEFVSHYLQISSKEADALRARGFLAHGTTAAWLKQEHNLEDIEEYLEFIHMKNVEDYIKVNPELISMLKALPIRRSILTNSIREHAERVLNVLGILHEFEYIFDIRDYDFHNKPSPKAYRTALDVLKLPAEQVLFIDDNIKFMQPFIDMGGNVLLIDEEGRHEDSPYPRIRVITELGDYLAEERLLG